MKKTVLIAACMWFIHIQIGFAQGKWIFDLSNTHHTVIQMCQDGYIVVGYANGSDLLTGDGTPFTPSPYTVTYSSYLLQDDFVDVHSFGSGSNFAHLMEFGLYVDDSGQLDTVRERQIGESFTMTIEERTYPFFTSDGRLRTWYDMRIVEWGELADVGRYVVVDGGLLGDLVMRVADCMLPEIGEIERVSVDTNGEEGEKPSYAPSLAADGSRIVFTSIAPNLDVVAFDENNVADIYLHTQTTGVTRLISEVDGLSLRIAADGSSTEPDISFEGGQVVYTSAATDLEIAPACPVDGTISHVYLYDWRRTQFSPISPTVRVDVPAECSDVNGAAYRPTINRSDYSIVMTTDSIVGDRISTAPPIIVLPPVINPPVIATLPSIIVLPTIPSFATLVPISTPTPTPAPLTLDNNGAADIVGDIFYDSDPVILSITNTGTTTETGKGGSDYASLSVTSEWVVFQTEADNFVADSVDSNGTTDIILRHTTGQTVTLVSVSSKGEQADAASFHPVISGNGRQIAFESAATNLVDDFPAGTTQIYVHHHHTRGCTTLLSRSSGGEAGNGVSTFPTMSADGRFIAFTSTADNLVPNDTNGFADIFIVDRDADNDGRFFDGSGGAGCTHDLMSIRRVSIGLNGAEANGDSADADFSADGAWIGFTSEADNLVEGDMNGAADVFVMFNGYPFQRVNIPLSVGTHATVATNPYASIMWTFGMLLLMVTLRIAIWPRLWRDR